VGKVYKGIHPVIALNLRDRLGLKTFVETGTYKGETVKWARGKFESIISIEISPEFLHRVGMELLDARDVLLIGGDSRERLAPVCRGLHNAPVLFWLDAHWTGEPEYKDPKGHLPLLDEIDAINENYYGLHAIMIDDYSLWYKPVEALAFPKLVDFGRADRQVVILDDVVIACRHMPEEYLK